MIPVIIATNGQGIPVVPVSERGEPAIVASSGRGVPIVITDPAGIPLTRGRPMIISNLPE